MPLQHDPMYWDSRILTKFNVTLNHIVFIIALAVPFELVGDVTFFQWKILLFAMVSTQNSNF